MGPIIDINDNKIYNNLETIGATLLGPRNLYVELSVQWQLLNTSHAQQLHEIKRN